jgi:hypothetical protein
MPRAATRDAEPLQTATPGHSATRSSAFEFLFHCPESAIALAEAAEKAAADMDAARRTGAAWPRAAREPAAAWLYTEGLPGVFTRCLKDEATFAVDSETVRRSACVRFIQAAHAAAGREQPTDAAIVQTVQRGRRAAVT